MIIQVGKNGLTEGIINTLRTAFETRKFIKMTYLKSSGRTHDSVEADGKKIIDKLGVNYIYHRMGFTLTVRKLAGARR
jgi:RNA-binding protein YhbY